MRKLSLAILAAAAFSLPIAAPGGEPAKRPNRARNKAATLAGPAINPIATLNSPDLDEDFAALCIDSTGTPWVAFVEFDGLADTLQLSRLGSGEFDEPITVSESGNIYQPCLACDGHGTVWCVWSQIDDGRWNLFGRSVVDGRLSPQTVKIAATKGNDLSPDLKTDRG